MSSLSRRLKLPYSIFLHYLFQSCWTSRWYWAHELRDSENPGCSSPVHPETLLLPSLSLFLPFPYSHLLWTSYSNLSELPEQPENCSHSVIKQAPLRKKLMWMVIKVSIQLKVGQMFNPASLQDIRGITWTHRLISGNVTSCCPSTASHRAGLQGLSYALHSRNYIYWKPLFY